MLISGKFKGDTKSTDYDSISLVLTKKKKQLYNIMCASSRATERPQPFEILWLVVVVKSLCVVVVKMCFVR